MRGFKRTISILLSLLIILSVFTIAPFTVNAEQTTDSSPAYVAYQAKRYSDPNGQNLFGDASKTYAQTYYNQMKKDNKVISGITIWEAAHIATSPTYSLESGLITKKDMYKLAIFDMLDLSESDTFVSNLLDMVNDSRLSYIVSVSKSICDPNDINVSELKNFEVNAEYINFLKESAKLAKAFDVVDKISTIASGCKNLYEAILTTANYQAISDMKNGTKEVLSAIYADTSNPSELRQAAYECVNNFGDGFDRILNTVSTGSNLCLNATLETIFKEAVDSIWSEIISVIPGGKVVMTAAKGMRVLSNAVFAMDDTCRIYYQFEADVTLEQAVRNVMNNARCDYIQDNNQDKAIAYMRAVEMYKRIVLQGYDYTKEMLEIKANAPATKWFDWFNHDYSECMELMEGVERIKNDRQKLYKQFEDWVHSDYINLYCKDYNETINGFNNQQTIKTDSVTLTQIKDINVGDSGYIYDYIKKTCQPENSTEYKKCYFTAENKDAFTIDKLGSFVAESAGQVTLIYDKGGELESSVTITVGSSPTDNKHDYYSDFKYSTFYNNSQQRTEATITEYTGSQSNLIIPYSIDGYIVTSIGRRTFIGCTSLKSINIPDSVTGIGGWAFYGCSSLTSVIIGNSVTSMDVRTFYGCTSLASINIPDSVTSIGYETFKDCISLTNMNIPDSVTSIGDSAFYGCTNLTSINIPDSVTSICDSTFRSCTSLTSVTVGNNITSIGDSTFYDCTSLTSINIHDGVTSIGDFTFYGCTSLTSINIPDGVTSIGHYAFRFCTSLTSINVPDSVTHIYFGAFDGCTSLTSITIPDRVTHIDGVFIGCTSLTSITIPDGITSVGDSAFEGCTSLISIKIPDRVTSIGNSTFSGCTNLTSINIPDGVTSIGGDAFSSCTSLTSITIPKSVKSIDYYAFYGCSSLTSITISNSVTSIGDSAFCGCTNLTSINIPDGVTSIGDSAFYGCTNLTSINIPDGVTSIGDSTFKSCTSLTSVTVGNGVTSIGDSVFYGCTSLTIVTVGNSVTSIGDSAFYGCTNLTSINIPDSVKSIGNSTFRSCTSLTSINIPDDVTSIGNRAFYDCTSLTSVTVGNSVTSIGDSTFYGCTNLTSINIPDGVTSIGNSTFSGCTNLTSINIPNSVTSIGDSAFSGCTNLTSINIPNSVTSIGDSAFDDCKSLTSINIPDGVTSIGYSAFYDCKSLTNITIPDGVTSIGNYAFSGCSSLTSIKIPNSVTSIGDAAFEWNYDLSDVLFMGSKEQWNSITMGSDNFSNAAIHYNAEYIKTVEPDCTNKGYDLYSCSECENGVKANFTDALGHNFVNGICEHCGKGELDCIESAHPYENDTDEKWTIHINNAKRIAVVFSDKTETESGSDYIYIYDKDNEEIGCYSGTELAGKRIVVQGDTITIRLTSDSSDTCYGFDITDVKPYYEECVHSETELINVREAGCGWEGYTGDVRCVECQEILSYGEYIDATEEHSIISKIIPPTCGQEGYTHHYCENCDYSYDDNYVDATGNHEFENGICKICGQPDIDCLENFKANDTKNIEITNGGEFKYFKFTPNKNGALNFYSVGTCDTYGCLFDSEMTELAYNDDGSEDYNFSITYDVIAGKTYILACRMYSSDTIGNFNTVLNFEPDDTALIGDVDGNGEVSITDATEIQKYLVQYVSLNEEQLKVSDTNGDGKVDIKDVTQIQKYIVQLISSLV